MSTKSNPFSYLKTASKWKEMIPISWGKIKMNDENLKIFMIFTVSPCFSALIPLIDTKCWVVANTISLISITSRTRVTRKTVLTEYHRILYLPAFLAVIYILVPLPIISVLHLAILHCLLQMCWQITVYIVMA